MNLVATPERLGPSDAVRGPALLLGKLVAYPHFTLDGLAQRNLGHHVEVARLAEHGFC